MAQVPVGKRFSVEEFKSESSWIGNLIQPINDFVQQVIYALSNRLSIQDNLFQEIKVIDLTPQSAGVYPLKFQTKFQDRVQAMWVANCQVNTSIYVPVGQAVYLDWNWVGNGQVQINGVTGLTNGTRYTLTVILAYG